MADEVTQSTLVRIAVSKRDQAVELLQVPPTTMAFWSCRRWSEGRKCGNIRTSEQADGEEGQHGGR